jgi:hypothetical protein
MKQLTVRMLAGAVLLCGASPAWAQLPGLQMGEQTPATSRAPEETIRDQLRAFNAHDPDAMILNLHESFAWFAVDSDVMTLEMQGRGNFHSSMVEYFANVPGARADIEEIFAIGAFVTTRERAYWRQGDTEMSQASLAVYEVRNGLIYRVWYYPAYD